MTHQEAVDTLATERYLLGEMSDEDRNGFEEHYFSCEICAEDVKTASALVQGAKTALAGPLVPTVPKPLQFRNASWYRSVAVPWAVAASFAMFAAYQSLLVVPELRHDLSPRALVPITLRPDTRGSSDPVVRSGPGSGPITLAVEVNDVTEGRELTYDITSSDGRRIASGNAAAPAAGTPLFLWIPSWTTVAPMRYILSVHDAAAGRSLGEYRFVLSP